MDTNRLKQFCAIVELGSLTKASQLLHITHAGLSKSMKVLQEEVDLVLMRSSGRGIAITDDGLLFYKHSKELLEHETLLLNLKKDTPPASLKIGMPLIFQLYMGESIKRHLFNAKSISILDLDPGSIEQLIAARQLDFGVTFIPLPHQGIEVIEVGKFALNCYHLKDRFQGKQLSEIPFATPSRSLQPNPGEIKERDGWKDSVDPRHKKFIVTHISAAIELVMQGLCAVYMPDFIAHQINSLGQDKVQHHRAQHKIHHKTLVEYPLPDRQKNILTAYIIRHKNQVEDAAFNQFYRIIKEIISSK